VQVAPAGIYDLRIHHDEIPWPLLRYWTCSTLRATAEGDQARERLAAHLAKLDRLASRFEAKRMRAAGAEEYASEPS
jgi:acyl-[acyl-carrier protein] desaturase